MAQKTKQIIIVAVVIVVAFFGFKMFFTNPAPTELTAETTTTGQFIDGQTILALLNNLNNVTLDNSIFSNKIFVSLVSFERPIEDQIIGRQNPFLPIGVDNSGVLLLRGTSTSATSSRIR